jgi:hypothetical protein
MGRENMSKNSRSIKVSRAGAYVVKAAESPSSRVKSKSSGRGTTPSAGDRRLAGAVLRNKTA